MDIEIKGSKFKVIVKPNSKANEVLGYDADKKGYRIAISAPADKDKANKELIRFLSKHLGKRVFISSGLRSKEKIVSVE